MRRYPLILLLTLSLLPLYACGGEPSAPSPAVTKVLQLKTRIAEVVTDEERQAQVLKLADKMEKLIKKLDSLNGSTRNKIFKAYKNPDTTQDDFKKIFMKHSEKRLKIVTELVDLRVKMRQLLSEEEWGRFTEGVEFIR